MQDVLALAHKAQISRAWYMKEYSDLITDVVMPVENSDHELSTIIHACNLAIYCHYIL